MLLPHRVDARTTGAGLRELAREADDPTNPVIGAVTAVMRADNSVEFRKFGLCERNTDRAARLAHQLADSLIWDLP